MNEKQTTTIESATTRPLGDHADVDAYAALVRSALADLPADDVDELMQDVTANLTDVAQESNGGLLQRLGTPAEYAAELRSAAGLGLVSSEPVVTRPRLTDRVHELARRSLDRWPWLHDLAPVWWVTRGLALGWLFCTAFLGARSVVVMLIAAAVSFWAGRAGDGWGRAPRAVLVTANVIGILALVPAAIWLVDRAQPETSYTYAEAQPAGLAMGGSLVANVYAFDATGARVDRVRLFDQDGNPLTVDSSAVEQDGSEPWLSGPLTVFPHTGGVFAGWATAANDTATGWVPPMVITPLLPDPPADATTPASTPPPATAPATPTPTTPATTTPTNTTPAPTSPAPTSPATSTTPTAPRTTAR